MHATDRVRVLVWIACLSAVAAFCGRSPARAEETFLRGDATSDGRVDLSDAVRILEYLFPAERRADLEYLVRCHETADVNDDGRLSITDAIFLLSALFRGGPEPPAPYPDCGLDPTPDALSCQEHYPCTPTVYGRPIESDLVVFFVEDSSAMGGKGEFAITKQELRRYLSFVPPKTQFGIVVGHEDYLARFPATGVPATGDVDSVEAAVEFIGDMSPSGQGCPGEGLLAAVDMAHASDAARREIVYIGSGRVSCAGDEPETYIQETLERVAEANVGKIPIHVIGILIGQPLHEELLQRLAAESGGGYHHQVW